MHADRTQQMLTQVHIIEFVLIVVLSLALFWILAKEEEGGINVVTVPILQDNFSYLIIDKKLKTALVVDPAEPEKVIEAARSNGVTISAILTTHHHWDHAGGNRKLLSLLPNQIPVYGGDQKVAEQTLTNTVKQNDTFNIGGIMIKVHSTPCHTSGHVVYEVKDVEQESSPGSLFTGDTLFIGGCGRFFEGTAEQMTNALCNVIGSLPPETKVYCGHEYTVSNLRFAQTIEPDNSAITEKLEWAKKQVAKGLPTVPSTIAEEKLYNPFMRVYEPSIAKSLGMTGASPVDIMQVLRDKKNSFK